MLLTVHGYLVHEAVADSRLARGSLSAALFLREEKMAYGNPSAIICVDERLGQHVRALCPQPPPITILPNTVNLKEYRFRKDLGAAQRAELGVGEEFVILCPRRLVRKNGVDIAVRAMAGVATAIPGSHLVIAGAGQEREDLERLVAGIGLSGRVSFLGAVNHRQMPGLYCAADVVVIPSVEVDGVAEATSISALEAMACERPVVASGLGGLAELIRPGQDGVLVPPGDPEELAGAIIRLYGDPESRVELGRNARARVEAAFVSAEHAATVLEVYRSAIAGSGSGEN